MENTSPALNIAANKLAQKWLGEIRSQLDALPPVTQAGCWLAILDRCALKRPMRTLSLTREQMLENVEQRTRLLHKKHGNRWTWPAYYVEFSHDCGLLVESPSDDAATRFATTLREVINYDRYNLAQLLALKEQIVDAILTFHGHRRATLVASASLEGVRLADEWIAKMEAEIVDVELKGRERFWEKVALGAKAYEAPTAE